MAKAPAFQTYASDYFMDTNSWTVDEIGIYQRLLLTEWVNGGLPNDEKRLARITGCSIKKFKKSWETISIKFKNGNFWESKEGLSIEIDRSLLESNKLYNPRLEIERYKQSKYKELQSQKGKMSVEARRNRSLNRGSTDVLTEPQPSSSTSSSNNKEKKIYKRKVLSDEEFLTSIKEKFTWVDFNAEIARMDAWLLANPKRQKTRKFISNWFIRKDKPLQPGNTAPTDPMDRRMWEIEQLRKKNEST